MKQMRVVLREMGHIDRVSKHPWLWPLVPLKRFIDFVPFWMAIWVNILIVLFYGNDHDKWSVTDIGPAVGWLVLVLNILQLIAVVLLITSFVVVDAPVKYIPLAVLEKQEKTKTETISPPATFEQDRIGALKLYDKTPEPLPYLNMEFSLVMTTLRYCIDPR